MLILSFPGGSSRAADRDDPLLPQAADCLAPHPSFSLCFFCWRSTRFSPRTAFVFLCGADHRHPSIRSWFFWRSSRFLLRHGTFRRTAEQIADIPVPGGLGQDFQNFPPVGQGRSSSGSFSGRAFSRVFFFRTFPQTKKSAKSAASPSPRVPRAGQPTDASGF